MNIGIDIDDTIANSFESIFANSQKFDIEIVGNKGNVNKLGKIEDHYYIETLYDWTKEQYDEFWKRYFMKAVNDATPKDDVAEILQKLKREGHHIYLITARYEDEEYTEVGAGTRKWLAKHHIPYDELVINAQNKAEVAKAYNLDVFVDDSFMHCKAIQNAGMKALLFTSMMNVAVEVKNDVTRVYSWEQVYALIQEYAKQKKMINV